MVPSWFGGSALPAGPRLFHTLPSDRKTLISSTVQRTGSPFSTQRRRQDVKPRWSNCRDSRDTCDMYHHSSNVIPVTRTTIQAFTRLVWHSTTQPDLPAWCPPLLGITTLYPGAACASHSVPTAPVTAHRLRPPRLGIRHCFPRITQTLPLPPRDL